VGKDTEFNFGHNVTPDSAMDTAQNAAENGEPRMCLGRVKCVRCGMPYGVCWEVEANLANGGNVNMLTPAGNQTSQQSQAGRGFGKKRSGFDYITEAELSTDKVVARILAVKENKETLREGQRRFSDVVVKIAFKGQTWLFGMKLDSPNLAILQQNLTLDENKWIGREFYLFIESEEFSGRNYPRVEVIPEKKPGVKK